MSTINNPPADRKHAYRVLDVPESASSHEIKSAYRKLIKRWHPDRFRAGTEEQAEATRMTELINEAYASIQKSGPAELTADRPVQAERREREPVYGVSPRNDDMTPAQRILGFVIGWVLKGLFFAIILAFFAFWVIVEYYRRPFYW